MFKAGDVVRWNPTLATIRSVPEEYKYLFNKTYKALKVYDNSAYGYLDKSVSLEAPLLDGSIGSVVVPYDECVLVNSTAVCECGAKSAGYKARQPGHSYWCPAA